MTEGGDRRSPMIDVLIPAYNAERTIVDAIGSIQRQTVRDIRIIAVNDGSTDRTGPLLHQLASTDHRVQVIDRQNGGIVSALNAAIDHSSAPILARHDADDLAYPERFAAQLAYLDRHPDCVAVGANVWQIDADGNRNGRQSKFAGDVRPDPHALPSMEPYLLHPFLMIRRAALVAARGYRSVFHSEDTDLYWRLLDFGRLHNLPQILGEYRLHTGSVTGASVHNGRIGAAYSQLAAISYLRRRAGVPDLTFPHRDLERLESVRTFENVLAVASERLTEEEDRYFRLAAPAKLLQLATYRPFALTLEDCRVVRRAMPALRAQATSENRRRLSRDHSKVAYLLLRNRRWRELVALGPPDRTALATLPSRLAHPLRLAWARVRRSSDHSARSRP